MRILTGTGLIVIAAVVAVAWLNDWNHKPEAPMARVVEQSDEASAPVTDSQPSVVVGDEINVRPYPDASAMPHTQLPEAEPAVVYTEAQLTDMRARRQRLETDIQRLMADYNDNLQDPVRRAEIETQISQYNTRYRMLMLQLGKAELRAANDSQ